MNYNLIKKIKSLIPEIIWNPIFISINKINHKFNILSSIEHNDNEDITKICECSICYDEKELHNFVKLGCNHEFCKDCLITTMKTSQTNDNNLSCALCRTEVKSVKSRTEQAHTEMSELIA